MKWILSTCLVLFFGLALSAQEVVVYDNFDDFEAILKKKDGKIYVVNFWATWCVPCIRELPYFEELNKKYKDKNVEVILTSLDFKKHLERKVKPFIRKKGLQSSIVLMDDPKANSWIDKVDPSWSGAIPATVFYNSDRKKFMEHEFDSFEELESVVLSFMDK